MTERERLIERIQDKIAYHADEKKYRYEIGKGVMLVLAMDIIADFEEFGGLFPPCKIGDTVYTLGHGNSKHPKKWQVVGVWFSLDPSYSYMIIHWYKDKNNFGSRQISFDEIGKTVFLTKEEAEAALKERGGNV